MASRTWKFIEWGSERGIGMPVQKAKLCETGQGRRHSIRTEWNNNRLHVDCWFACLPCLSSSCSSLNFSSVSPLSSNLTVNSLTWFKKSRLVSSPTGLAAEILGCICQSRHPVPQVSCIDSVTWPRSHSTGAGRSAPSTEYMYLFRLSVWVCAGVGLFICVRLQSSSLGNRSRLPLFWEGGENLAHPMSLPSRRRSACSIHSLRTQIVEHFSQSRTVYWRQTVKRNSSVSASSWKAPQNTARFQHFERESEQKRSPRFSLGVVADRPRSRCHPEARWHHFSTGVDVMCKSPIINTKNYWK